MVHCSHPQLGGRGGGVEEGEKGYMSASYDYKCTWVAGWLTLVGVVERVWERRKADVGLLWVDHCRGKAKTQH